MSRTIEWPFGIGTSYVILAVLLLPIIIPYFIVTGMKMDLLLLLFVFIPLLPFYFGYILIAILFGIPLPAIITGGRSYEDISWLSSVRNMHNR